MKAPGLAASPPSPPTPWPAPNLPPTFLLLPDESTRGSSPAAAGSRRVPASSGRLHQQWPEWQWREWPTPPRCPTARHLDSAGTQSEEQDKERGRELALATQLGSLQNTRTQPKTLHPHYMLDRPADRCATTRQWQIRQTNAEKHINLALSFSPYMPVLSCIILKQGLLFTMFILCHT